MGNPSALLGSLKVVWSFGSGAFSSFLGKKDSDEIYIYVVRELRRDISSGFPFEHEDIQNAISILAKLPSLGARRGNFQRYYLQNIESLKKLPSDPDRLSWGFWW